MNIKSLLLGSAAAFAVVSGARAADVVVAQPEPVEYVKVCDAYGAGFFYIPGTDTCLQISGYVWGQVQGASGHFDDEDLTASYYGPEGGMTMSERYRINFDVRSQTELGTLRGYIRLQGDNSGSALGYSTDIPTGADQAYLDFLGFRIGYSETDWVNSAVGGDANWGSHSWGGMYYGYRQVDKISYGFTQNGFFGSIAAENDASGYDATGNYGNTGNYDGHTDWTPDVVGLIGYSGGWGAVWAKAAYDNRLDNYDYFHNNSLSGWSAQIGTQINMPNMPGSSLRVLGYYNSADTSFGTSSPTWVYGGWGQSEWAVLVSYQQQFSDKFTGSVGFEYFDNFYEPLSDVKTGANGYMAELSLVYTPVKNFEIRSELNYSKIDSNKGSTSGFLRFTRYF